MLLVVLSWCRLWLSLMHHGEWTFWCAYWKDYEPFSFAQDIRIEFSNCVCSTAFFFALIEYTYVCVCIWLHINFIRRLLMHKRTTSTTKITTVNIIDLWEQYTSLSFSLSLYMNIELDNANNSLLHLVRVSFFPCHMYWFWGVADICKQPTSTFFFRVCCKFAQRTTEYVYTYIYVGRS